MIRFFGSIFALFFILNSGYKMLPVAKAADNVVIESVAVTEHIYKVEVLETSANGTRMLIDGLKWKQSMTGATLLLKCLDAVCSSVLLNGDPTPQPNLEYGEFAYKLEVLDVLENFVELLFDNLDFSQLNNMPDFIRCYSYDCINEPFIPLPELEPTSRPTPPSH